MEINLPQVHAELAGVFARYEHALVNNLVEELDALFWAAPQTVRYGAGENLVGIEAIRAFRLARSPVGLARTLHNTVITTYGHDFGTVSTEFRRAGSHLTGRQMQTWVRFAEGWKVVAAHVSMLEPA